MPDAPRTRDSAPASRNKSREVLEGWSYSPHPAPAGARVNSDSKSVSGRSMVSRLPGGLDEISAGLNDQNETRYQRNSLKLWIGIAIGNLSQERVVARACKLVRTGARTRAGSRFSTLMFLNSRISRARPSSRRPPTPFRLASVASSR